MNLDLRGPAGLLEAVLHPPRQEVGQGGLGAVVCHPHPLLGGSLQNKVTYRLARGLGKAGFTVLRFNFRGVGRSGGSHDEGVGEVDDLRAAVKALLEHVAGARLLLAGYSFGAHVASRLFVEEARAEALIAAGPPLRIASFEHLVRCQKAKHLLVAERDEFGELDLVRRLFDRMAEPKTLQAFSGADHAFGTCLDALEAEVAAIGRDFAAGVNGTI